MDNLRKDKNQNTFRLETALNSIEQSLKQMVIIRLSLNLKYEACRAIFNVLITPSTRILFCIVKFKNIISSVMSLLSKEINISLILHDLSTLLIEFCVHI